MASGRSTLRNWVWVHKWSSIICTLFLLMLCVTGLPLIFNHEIDDLLHEEIKPAAVSEGTSLASLDQVVANTIAHEPGHVPHFLIWDPDDASIVRASIGKAITDDPTKNRIARVDAYRAVYLDAPDVTGRFTHIMLQLHTDMFAGLPGKLFLGLMGLLFCVAIVSGIVVYAPAMRKLRFGTYRSDRPRIVRWLDVHNLSGILLGMWMLVVGFTGVINTWADLVLRVWQFGQLGEMTAPYKDRPLPVNPASIEAAVQLARKIAPDMKPAFVSFPGSIFSSRAHYAVFMRGDTPLTSRLARPVLIDANTGAFTEARDLPWYVKTLLISQPLHFGDYGGLPLRIIWAILDMVTIVVLVTGLYLWLRRGQPRDLAKPAAKAAVSPQDRPVLTS